MEGSIVRDCEYRYTKTKLTNHTTLRNIKFFSACIYTCSSVIQWISKCSQCLKEERRLMIKTDESTQLVVTLCWRNLPVILMSLSIIFLSWPSINNLRGYRWIRQLIRQNLLIAKHSICTGCKYQVAINSLNHFTCTKSVVHSSLITLVDYHK